MKATLAWALTLGLIFWAGMALAQNYEQINQPLDEIEIPEQPQDNAPKREEPPPPKPAPKPAPSTTKAQPYYPGSEKMAQAKKIEDWGRIYYDSYRRTQEAKYLSLALEHTQQAIEAYAEIQSEVKTTNPFYHKARRQRMDSCGLFQLLQNRAMNWQGRVKVPKLDAELCEDK